MAVLLDLSKPLDPGGLKAVIEKALADPDPRFDELRAEFKRRENDPTKKRIREQCEANRAARDERLRAAVLDAASGAELEPASVSTARFSFLLDAVSNLTGAVAGCLKRERERDESLMHMAKVIAELSARVAELEARPFAPPDPSKN